MPDLEINVFNQKLKLSYKENEKDRILKAVSILNSNWSKFSHLHGKVSDLKIATLISLELQDSIGDIQSLKEQLRLNQSNNDILKKEIASKKKEAEENFEKLKKLENELRNKDKEISKFENVLDDFHSELLKIKSNFLKNE